MPASCYMCDQPSTSAEHVPPKCLFPEKKDLPEGVDLRKQLITVPACYVHNTRKSKNDEYLLFCLVMSIPSNEVGENQFLSKVMRAIERNPGLINQFLIDHQPVVIEDTETSKVENTIAIKIDDDRLNEELDHLSRAIYFHHCGEKWNGEIDVYPNFLLSLDQENARDINDPLANMDNLSNQLFENIEFHGENPEVFKYQIIDGSKLCHKFLRLYFYNGNRVTIFVGRNG